VRRVSGLRVARSLDHARGKRRASPRAIGGCRSAAVAIVASLGAQACMAAEDEWTSGDKRAHFAGGLVVGGQGIAVAGELLDAARYGWNSKHSSAKDFGAGCLGAVTGAFISVEVASHRITWRTKF
jgi:hypothetical protein